MRSKRIPVFVVTVLILPLAGTLVESGNTGEDWNALYVRYRQEALAHFVQPNTGSTVTVYVTVGSPVNGLLDSITPLSVGVRTENGLQIIERRRISKDSRCLFYGDDFASGAAAERISAEKRIARDLELRSAVSNAAVRATNEAALKKQTVEREAAIAAEKKEQQNEKVRKAYLVIGPFRWSAQYGYVTAEGEVVNVSGKKLDNVEAVAKFYDADGTFITSSDALIEYRPLMPGQSSPYKIMVPHNPVMNKASVQFKLLSGQEIPTVTRAEYDTVYSPSR